MVQYKQKSATKEDICRNNSIGNGNGDNDKNHVNVTMMGKQDRSESSKMNQGHQEPVAGNGNIITSRYQMEGSVNLRVQSSQMFKIIIISLAVLLGLGCLVCLKMNSLENRINSLQLELYAVKQMRQYTKDFSKSLMDDEGSEEVFSSSSSNPTANTEHEPVVLRRGRRAITPEVKRQNLSSTSSESFETGNTTSNSSKEFSSRTSRAFRNSTGRKTRDRERGNAPTKMLERLAKANLRRIAEKEKRMQLRAQLLTARSLAANLSDIIARKNDIRAVYLRPSGAHVNIVRAEQFIGPWHMAHNEKDIGFNGLWYSDLSFDTNSTSVIFNENGLYSITSQIYYHLSPVQKDKSMPMGYRIYVKKGQPSKFQQPFSVAECVTSFPNTYYQTCLTAVTWYLEKGDEIFLKHFKNSLPIIEADEQGKTFLQIIRLGG